MSSRKRKQSSQSKRASKKAKVVLPEKLENFFELTQPQAFQSSIIVCINSYYGNESVHFCSNNDSLGKQIVKKTILVDYFSQFFLLENGQVWQHPHEFNKSSTLQQVPLDKRIVDIGTGTRNLLALADDGTVITNTKDVMNTSWGGTKAKRFISSPMRTWVLLEDSRVFSIEYNCKLVSFTGMDEPPGNISSFAEFERRLFLVSRISGKLYNCYSYNPQVTLCTSPDFSDKPLAEVVGCYGYVMFLDAQGSVWSLGKSKHGALGVDQLSCTVPRRVRLKAPVDRVVCTRTASFFVTRNHLIYASGDRTNPFMSMVNSRFLKVKKPERLKHKFINEFGVVDDIVLGQGSMVMILRKSEHATRLQQRLYAELKQRQLVDVTIMLNDFVF